MAIGIIIVVAVLIIGGIIYDTIVSNKIMKESENKIVNMLSKIYDTAEIVIIGLFTSLFSWTDNDIDDDLDTKVK